MKFFLLVFLLFSTEVTAQRYLSEYKPVSHNALANLMWKYGAHELDDDIALKTYFQIHYCPVFEKYYKDDFLWQTIMEGFKRNMKYFSKDFPNKFYIIAVIPIDRYDFTKSAFVIDSRAALDNAGSIQIPFYEDMSVRCGKSVIDYSVFPRNMKFLADRKFSLKEIPMKPDDANELLENIRQYRYEGIESDRVLTVRFLLNINGVSYDISEGLVVFKGTLDEMAFFEDPQLTIPVWKKQFKRFEE